MATELQKEVTAPQKESSTCWQQCQPPQTQTGGRWLPSLGTPCCSQPWLGSPWLEMQRLTWVGRAHMGATEQGLLGKDSTQSIYYTAVPLIHRLQSNSSVCTRKTFTFMATKSSSTCLDSRCKVPGNSLTKPKILDDNTS